MDGVFENLDKKSNLLGLPFRTLDRMAWMTDYIVLFQRAPLYINSHTKGTLYVV